jgi:hypothetical protein
LDAVSFAKFLWNYIRALMEKVCKVTFMISFKPPYKHLLGGSEERNENIKVNVSRPTLELRTGQIQNKIA